MNKLFLPYLSCLLAGGLLLGSCIDPYSPNVPEAAQSYLVVDGFLNSQGSTVIKLSRTLGLAASTTVPVEAKATVYIQDDAGTRYALVESPAGTYTSPVQTLNPSRQYQLRITTAKNRTYASDLVPVKNTPPIDKLRWQPDGPGVQIYVSAHDASNNTRYYRWDYTETWQYTSAFQSNLEYVKTSNTIRDRTDDIYHCWRSQPSTTVRQSTTAKLSQDVVADFPLLLLPFDERLRIKYSILVQQYAQTQTEYDYWELLRKNTEAIGTINDPLPTQLTGNVHCLTDAAEVVLGYVGAHSMTQQRLFIDYYDLPKPRPLIYNDSYSRCTIDTVLLKDATTLFKVGGYVPIVNLYNQAGFLFGYSVSGPECVDCRLRGTNVKPSFWP